MPPPAMPPPPPLLHHPALSQLAISSPPCAFSAASSVATAPATRTAPTVAPPADPVATTPPSPCSCSPHLCTSCLPPSCSTPSPAIPPLPAGAHPPPPDPPLPAMRPPQFDSHLSTNHHNSSTSPPPPPFSHTCFHSSRTGDALCVHTPFCMRHDSLVYLSDNLRCAPFTDPHGLTRTLSMSRCVELQRDVEQRAHIENVQYKSSNWLTSLHQKHTALWFEGHTAFVRMTQSCLSVTHFAHRMFMLHHVLQHPHRYQLSPVANVVIAAHPDVARKIRFSKSWHHGLLAAVVHPNPIVYSFSAIRTAVTRPPSDPASLRVFVAPGLWHMAKGRHVPCFRRAALLPAVRTRMFLTRDAYPGVVVVDSPARNRSAAAAAPPPPPPPPSRYHDAHAFRALLFRSLRYGARPPRMQRRLLYLHRSRTRTLSAPGAALLERTLRGVARQFGLRYERVDHSGKTFAQQVHAVGTAAILVGVHGTQLLSSLFVARTAALVEIMPFQYGSELFEGGSGGGLFYARHSVLHGDHFPQLQQYASLDECRRNSRACREWYKSDERTVQFGEADAASVRTLSEQAGAYVIRKLEVEDRDEGQEQEQER